ncbi:hypothetical protein MUP01_12810 [Candidatus Bathyarchaeota archaeon]|nr:hypothetical protein [Candidatus Bathyarchaeota archaeon]
MKLLEDLKLKFPMKEFSPYGFCVVVPGAEFDPDWEAELVDHGYKCFDLDVGGEPVTLVRVVKTEKGSGEKTVPSPPPAAKASAEAEGEKETFIPGARSPPSQKWRPEEDKVLVKLWNEGGLIEKMTPSFPGRTETAIRLRIQRLEKRGKIKKRTGRGRPKKAKEVASPVDTPMPTSTPTPLPTPSPAPANDEVVELLKQILEAVKPKEESVCFESYCPSCRKSSSVEDSNVWKACPVCGGPLIVWNVEAGKESS